MRGYAAYLMRGRLQAIALVAMTAYLGLFFSPISYLAGAAVALVTLRLGTKEGTIVVAGSAVAIALMGMLASHHPAHGLVHMLMLGIPVMMMAQLLRQTVSLPLTFQTVALIGVVIVLTIEFFGQTWVDEWRIQFEQIIGAALEAASQQGSGVNQAELKEVMQLLGEKMSGILGAVFVFSQLVMLLLARNWQAKLYNPGGFSQEFQGLKLGKTAAYISLVILLAGTLPGETGELFSNMLGIVMVLFLMQFLAIAHAVIAHVAKSDGWLAALYVLVVIGLFAFPPLLLVMVLTGFADVWVDFRNHIKKQS
ncbi:MAG: YybS family protein [Gammaproteobacteria bacterium]|nr:YybS family protein [Gammaproteobacteria bacterium]MDH5594528.1 YybS family protein [Gammaproteobacteria bacterium]